MRKAHARPEHIPDANPCTRCGLPFLWHRVRNPTLEYIALRQHAKTKWLESRRKEREEEQRLAHSRLGAMIQEYESRADHVTEAFKRKLFEAWWQTRRTAVRHQMAAERLVRHLGRGPFTWKGHIYQADVSESIEIREVSDESSD
jgi:hypothetical protein